MVDVKTQHIMTLARLLSKGARYNFVPLTTTDLGKAIKRSQQAASKHLLDLERGGFIERTTNGRYHYVRVTEKGYDELIRINNVLDSCINATQSDVVLKGELVSGMGEGAYYMSLKGYARQFKTKVGYVPFPGTLNVRLSRKEYIDTIKRLDLACGVHISGFGDGRRTYGWVKCFPGEVSSVKSHLIRLERTHHDPSIIEIISPYNIRKAAGLSNGDSITIKVTV